MQKSIKKVLVLGQAPPARTSDVPFGRTRLYKWLAQANISQDTALETFAFGAVVNKFPGKTASGRDRAPSLKEIAQHTSALKQLLRTENPNIILSVGTLANRVVLDDQRLLLEDIVGKKFYINPLKALSDNICIIPFPHPSGGSSWVYKANNASLLNQALDLLHEELFTVSPV